MFLRSPQCRRTLISWQTSSMDAPAWVAWEGGWWDLSLTMDARVKEELIPPPPLHTHPSTLSLLIAGGGGGNNGE